MTDMVEVKKLVSAEFTAWEEYKKANDARLAAVEKNGHAPSDLVEKVDRINADLSKYGKDVEELLKKANRPTNGNAALTAEQIEHKQAFGRYLRKGHDDGLHEIERKAMQSQSDPDGGYLIVPEMDAAIDRVVGTVSTLPGLVRTINIGTARWSKLVKTSGLSMTRVAEGATAGETTNPKYAHIDVDVHPAEVEPWVFNETLEDARIDLEADLSEEAAIGFAEGMASEIVSGNGVGKCRGFTAYTNVANASYAWGKIGYIVSGKSADFASVAPGDKIVDLQHALKSQYRPGAVFVMNDATLGKARQMKDGSGQYYLWQPDPLSGFAGRLLGSPVSVDDNMAAIAANSYSIAFGNFRRGYALVQRSGTALIRDNITAKGKTKFNFRRRFGGGVYNFEAIKLMKFATS